jgi:hypothetical protein
LDTSAYSILAVKKMTGKHVWPGFLFHGLLNSKRRFRKFSDEQYIANY